MVGDRSRKPWTGDEPVGFDPSTFRQTFPRWIRHWCAKRFAKSCAFQQTRVSSNLTSTAKCVGGRAANATACRAVLPCGANTGGSSPSRRTKFYGRGLAVVQTCKLKPLRIGVRISPGAAAQDYLSRSRRTYSLAAVLCSRPSRSIISWIVASSRSTAAMCSGIGHASLTTIPFHTSSFSGSHSISSRAPHR
jgi:hypothetical protein